MRNTIQKRFLPVLVFGIIALLAFSVLLPSCAKDNTECVLEITVKKKLDGSVVPGAEVRVAPPVVRTDLLQEGISDGNGVFRCTFKDPAICDILASKDGLSGSSRIELKVGETVYTGVVLE